MRLRVALATAALSAVALVGLAACGSLSAATGTAGSTDSATSLTPEASALSALGFSPMDVTAADATPVGDPSPSAGTGSTPRTRVKRPALRALTLRRTLARNVQHGEVVVKTKNGDKTIDVQRGTVTAINSSTVTVKSSDGFTQTWTFGSPIHVIEHRASVQPGNVAAGATVGIAGTKSGGTLTAALLVIAQPK
jgi:hypothetical protein